MNISKSIAESIEKSSWIRRMFEEGAKLKAKFGPENIFDFSIGNPDLSPPEEFYSGLKKIAEDHSPGIHGYMPNAGYADVRQTIADKINNTENTKLSEKSIIMTCGAAGGLNVIFKTILNPGDEVIVIAPYFVEYGFYVSNHGGSIKVAQTKSDFSLDIDAIKNAITEKTKAIILNSPNNPTGRIYPAQDIAELASALNELNTENRTIFLLSDEPYRDIVYDNVVVPSLFKYYDHTLVVTSYSKTLSIPGERIGYIAVNPDCCDFDLLINGLILSNRILGFVNAPAIMQRLIANLQNSQVEVEIYKKRRDILAEGLAEAGYSFAKPEGAFYIFCASPIEDDVKFARHLQKYNILVVPGSGFGRKGYFRISYCTHEDIIAKSIPAFSQALKDLKTDK